MIRRVEKINLFYLLFIFCIHTFFLMNESFKITKILILFTDMYIITKIKKILYKKRAK
jgi:hypothetical protein